MTRDGSGTLRKMDPAVLQSRRYSHLGMEKDNIRRQVDRFARLA